jgi:hypothetical protein
MSSRHGFNAAFLCFKLINLALELLDLGFESVNVRSVTIVRADCRTALSAVRLTPVDGDNAIDIALLHV